MSTDIILFYSRLNWHTLLCLFFYLLQILCGIYIDWSIVHVYVCVFYAIIIIIIDIIIDFKNTSSKKICGLWKRHPQPHPCFHKQLKISLSVQQPACSVIFLTWHLCHGGMQSLNETRTKSVSITWDSHSMLALCNPGPACVCCASLNLIGYCDGRDGFVCLFVCLYLFVLIQRSMRHDPHVHLF